MQESTIWGIHAEHGIEATGMFLKENAIIIGWSEVGDLTQYGQDRVKLREALATHIPEAKPGALPVWAGMLIRFAQEIKPGDLVVYPTKKDRMIHMGHITGPYVYDTQGGPYPNRRAVTWLKQLPRTHFSQGALYEAGSALTLFQIKNYADEFRAAVEGKELPSTVTVADDPSVGPVAEEIEETTRDFILKTLSQQLKGHPFAAFVAQLLNTMGYRTRVSPPGPDSGIDIVAHRDELGFEPPIIKVQVKSTSGNIGNPEVASLYGNIAHNEHGLFVTLGSYTAQATHFARGKSNLRLIDGTELVDLVLAHYDEFDSRYKGILPLKRVYIPSSLQEES